MRWLACLLSALLLAGAAPAQANALDAFNRQVFAFNRSLAEGVDAVRARLPEAPALPDGLREGAASLLTTWIGQPWHAATLALAGREEDALLALRRAGVNILEGGGGWRDVATARGLPVPPPSDLGLALCARGVPAGPYIVLPLLGGRTLRDGATDLLLANLLVYLASIPFIGTVPSVEMLVAVELLDNIPAWILAREMDGVARIDPRGLDPEATRTRYLELREASCAALRAGRPGRDSVDHRPSMHDPGEAVLQR